MRSSEATNRESSPHRPLPSHSHCHIPYTQAALAGAAGSGNGAGLGLGLGLGLGSGVTGGDGGVAAALAAATAAGAAQRAELVRRMLAEGVGGNVGLAAASRCICLMVSLIVRVDRLYARLVAYRHEVQAKENNVVSVGVVRVAACVRNSCWVCFHP